MDERDANSAKDNAKRGPTYGNNSQFRPQDGAIKEPSEEGGASILVRANKTRPNADIVENSATMKKRESIFTSRQLTNYATNSDYEDRGGMFVMRHRASLNPDSRRRGVRSHLSFSRTK